MKKTYSAKEARALIRRYCAYQERCHQEVRSRLYDYGLSRDDVDAAIAELITEGFLNEERFARTFAGSKFRLKKWGRIKIVQELETKGVSGNCIKAGLREIDEDSYRETLQALLEKKYSAVSTSNIYEQRDRLSRFAIRKGYEPELVWSVLREIAPDQR